MTFAFSGSKFNEYKVDKANSFFSLNDFILKGQIENGNFLNSQIKSIFETYKFGDEYRFQIKGNLDGPFSTLTELTFSNLTDFLYVNRTVDGRSEGDYSVVKNFFKRAKLRDDIFQDLAFFTKYIV